MLNRLRRLRWRPLALEALLLAALVAAVSFWQARGLPEGTAPELAATDSAGRPVDLAGLAAAGRPVLVAFWASWCSVCAAEADNLAAVARDHAVITVAMQSGNAAAVSQHLQEHGLNFAAIADADAAIAGRWRIRGVPAHFVIDGNGRIRFRVIGYATEWGLRARLWWAGHVPG